MKKQILHSISVFMAFLILFSSLGFTLYAHECKISHIKEVSSSAIAPCCSLALEADSQGLILKKTPCCKLTKEFKKVETSQQIHLAKNQFSTTFFLIPFSNFGFLAKPQFYSIFEKLVFQSHAPPLSTSIRLAILQCFLI